MCCVCGMRPVQAEALRCWLGQCSRDSCQLISRLSRNCPPLMCSVYQAPDMVMLDKRSIKMENVQVGGRGRCPSVCRNVVHG